MSTPSAARLLEAASLHAEGPVVWGEPVDRTGPGVYVVEVPEESAAAPLDVAAVRAWIERVPSLRLDGARPSAPDLAARLASFWIPGEAVVYIGLAGTSVAKRVRQYYRTPLGDRRPHAGGHWVRTLSSRDELLVWWAAADGPTDVEAELLAAFADRHEGRLPFANRQSAAGARKLHGISGSVLADVGSPSAPGPAGAPTPGSAAGGGADLRLHAINAALQTLARRQGGETNAIEGGAELDRLGLLSESSTRRGLPLRNLLRADKIAGAYQDGSRRWRIKAAGDGPEG